MKNKLSIILSIAASLALIGATVFAPQSALAQSGDGTGTLTASGDGLAGIRGQGNIRISGNGVLMIRDQAGDASIRVTGNGQRVELPGGWIRYVGFQGEATVSGNKVTVALSGYDIHLEASGSGKFVLRGNGTYQVGHLSGSWTEGPEVHSLP